MPPLALTADVLFVAALCPTAPLRSAFPDVPFLSLLGRTPLVIWFGRFRQLCDRDASGAWHCEGGPTTVLYDELNVLALLRRRALFVPGIYATAEPSFRIARQYGIPKRRISIRFPDVGRRIEANAWDGDCQSFVRARLLGLGRLLAWAISWRWPWQSWPVRFANGAEVRGIVRATPRVDLACVQQGRLAVAATWLPAPVPLLPIGLYVSKLAVFLP